MTNGLTPERLQVLVNIMRDARSRQFAAGKKSTLTQDHLIAAVEELCALKTWGYIALSPAEKQSGLDRVKQAENLIGQLPRPHDGAVTWMLNFGRDGTCQELRRMADIEWDPHTQSAKPRVFK
jgi:hypothetical protein